MEASTSDKRRVNLSAILLGVLILAALAGLTWMNFRFSDQNPGGNDFLARWNGARFWVVEHVSPYADQVGLPCQEMIYGRPAIPFTLEDKCLFVYPFYSLIFFGPFGFFDFPVARAIWMTLLECCLVGTLMISLRLVRWNVSTVGLFCLVLFSLFWYPGVRTLVLGQYSGVNAVLILGALLLILKGQDIPAGFLLALSTSKPQMAFLIIPFTLLWAFSRRRWKLLLGILGGGAGLVLGSMLLLPRWPVEWYGQMIDYPSYTGRFGTVVEIIAGAIPTAAGVLTLLLDAVLGLWLAYEWFRVWGKGERHFLWTALLTLVITNFIAFRTATPHYVLLLPILLMLCKYLSDRWGKSGRRAAWAIVGLVFVGLWAIFLLSVEGNAEAAVNYVPLPVLSLLILAWLRKTSIDPSAKAAVSIENKLKAAE